MRFDDVTAVGGGGARPPRRAEGQVVVHEMPRRLRVKMPLLQRAAGMSDVAVAGEDHRIDADGFVHIAPEQSAVSETPSDPERWVSEIARFMDGLGVALRRDLMQFRKVA